MRRTTVIMFRPWESPPSTENARSSVDKAHNGYISGIIFTVFIVAFIRCKGPYTNHVAFFRPLFDHPSPLVTYRGFSSDPPPNSHVFFLNFLEYHCTRMTVTQSS